MDVLLEELLPGGWVFLGLFHGRRLLEACRLCPLVPLLLVLFILKPFEPLLFEQVHRIRLEVVGEEHMGILVVGVPEVIMSLGNLVALTLADFVRNVSLVLGVIIPYGSFKSPGKDCIH